jgi:hypothetical protein
MVGEGAMERTDHLVLLLRPQLEVSLEDKIISWTILI